MITTNATCAQPNTLTLEGMRKMIDEVYAKFPPVPPDPWAYVPLRPSFDIIERPLPPPKIQVGKEAESIFTPKDLAEMNAYLLERFGRYEQDCNLYHFSHYLIVPVGMASGIGSILNSVGA